jgi:hypothetical protein
MFFAGRLPRLPWETRARVDALVKHYDRLQIRNTAERFRFSTLQARYVAFCDLWERTLRTKEEGRARGAMRSMPPPAVAKRDTAQVPPPLSEPLPRPAADTPPSGPRVVAVASFRDPANEPERLSALYEQLSDARRRNGEQPLPFERFSQVVRAQVSKLGRGSGDVAFRVAVEDGKVTLTAKSADES